MPSSAALNKVLLFVLVFLTGFMGAMQIILIRMNGRTMTAINERLRTTPAQVYERLGEVEKKIGIPDGK